MPTKKSPKPAPSTSSGSRTPAKNVGPTTKKAKKPTPIMRKGVNGSHTRAFVSYITIVGWLIAYFVMKPEDSEYELFHLKQSLGLHLSIMVCEILKFVLFFLLPFLWIAYIVALVVFAFKAKDGKKETVPYLGEKFQEWFSFL